MRKSEFVKLIKEYIEDHKLTHIEFCERAKVSPQVLDNILNDGLYVSFHDYRSIADVIGVNYSNNMYFVFDTE